MATVWLYPLRSKIESAGLFSKICPVERARELLEGGEPSDAVIIWSCHSLDGNHLAAVVRKAARPIVDAILAPVAREDSQKLLLVTHLMRNSEEQRVATPDEILARLRED